MHSRMAEAVVRARVIFFDSNPIGRILTRFSKDIATLDLIMPNVAVLASFGIFRALTVVMVVCYIHFEMVPFVFFVVWLMSLIANKGRNVMRESQRMDSIYRGPIHSAFATVVNGLVTLRAYERIGYFRAGFMDQLEKSCNITFTYMMVNRWIGMSYDLICVAFTLFTASFSIYAKDKVDSEYLAFILQIITDVIVFFGYSVRMTADMENHMTCS